MELVIEQLLYKALDVIIEAFIEQFKSIDGMVAIAMGYECEVVQCVSNSDLNSG